MGRRFVRVLLDELLPFHRHIKVLEDRFDWAFRDADGAVDALFWIDGEHSLTFVETVNGAHRDAVGVPAINAGFADDVGHAVLS